MNRIVDKKILVRFAAMMVMMMAWMGSAMAQRQSAPAEGVYFIRNTTAQQAYLWPSVVTNSTTGQHYLTTLFSTEANTTQGCGTAYDKSYSHWVVKHVNDNTFQLIHPRTNKYVVIRDKEFGDRDVWLDDLPDNDHLIQTYFTLNGTSSPYLVSPTDCFQTPANSCNLTNRTLNSASGNDKNGLGSGDGTSTSDQRSGLIQFYTGSPTWTFILDLLDAPTFSVVSQETGRVTVTDSNGLPEGYNVLYTVSYNGTDPADPTSASDIMVGGSFLVANPCIVKAVVERYGVVLTSVARAALEPTIVVAPTLTPQCDNTMLMESQTNNASIYYTINGADPTPTHNNGELLYDAANPPTLNNGAVVKARAYKDALYSSITTSSPYEIHTEAPTITLDSTMVSISGPDGATIYYTTDGNEPTINPLYQYQGPFTIELSSSGEVDIRAIAESSGLLTSCVTRLFIPTAPSVNITSDDCSVSEPRGNILTIIGPDDGRTFWYAATARENTPAPDINAIPNPYSQYTDVVALDDLDGTNTYYTIHVYAKSSDGLFNSSVVSVSREMKTGGKPELTPPVGSNPVLLISGGVYDDKAVITIDMGTPENPIDDITREVDIVSDGTAEFPIPNNATGILTVVFKHGDWQPSCEATYEIPAAPAAPTFSQDCANLLSLHCETPMADIHFTTDGTEPTLASHTYVAGCLDTLSVGRRIRAKAFLGFRASGELDYTYSPLNPDEPQFVVDGTYVYITAPDGTTVYYTKSEGTEAGVVPADPDIPTSDSTAYTGRITIASGNIITVFKAIAISNSNPEHQSCVKRVVTREGYSINTANDLTKLRSNPESYFFVFNDIDASAADGEHVFTTVEEFTGVLDGNFHTISNLNKPLFDNIHGSDTHNAAVLNVMLKKVTVSTDGNAGAIANTALGYTRIYNCGILPDDPDGTTTSSISGADYVGGLVGELDGTSRVINCFSYANITGGTHRAGIVGYNKYASKSGDLKTMVMNCMFYGNITSGYTAMSPIYGGLLIHNKRADANDTGLNNYCYFLYKDQDYLSAITTYAIGKGSLGAEERFLNRFEFFRLTLNSTRSLAAFYVYGDATEKDQMAKWVLDKSIAPYPILKEPGYYPSIVNYDAEHAAPIDPDNVYYNQGRKLGTLRVNIRMGNGAQFNHPGTGDNEAQIITSQLNLNVIDKDPNNFNFNYKKIQLPYYNQVGSKNYTGNRVVTGWKIVEINDSGTGTGTFVDTGTDAPAFNFVDRACSNKDLYSVSGRVFNQGAYWEVPDGVTSITIEPYWAKAAYLSDANYDVTYSGNNKYGVTVAGTCINSFNNQTVRNTVSTAMSDLGGNASHTVYDYAVVLVGNYHQYTDNAIVNDTKPVTFMSADLDGDLEPDNTLFYYHNSRKQVSPIRFDFVNIPGVGTVKRTWDSNTNPQPGIFRPRGWFEITNTALIRCGQFEYASSNHKTIMAPLILQGGIYEQFVSCQATYAANTNYILVGSNAWFKNLANGCHTETYLKTPKVPINVAGGEYGNLYLSGIYQENGTPDPENAECYIDGGSFTNVAGAGMQKIDGNVDWFINAADIVNFYGGGINAAQHITGNITTQISNSRVGKFYGGPMFGDMEDGKTVTNTALDCHFDLFFGAGYGGTAFKRKDCVNTSEVNDHPSWGTHVTTHYKRKYSSSDGGISTNYQYEFILHSDGNKTVARFFVNYASLSLASTHNVVSDLTGCTMRKFYGGGRLGAVKGDVTSTLTDCTVVEDVFGSGYSADAPTVDVFPIENMNPDPQYNRPAGVFNDAQVKFPTGVTFTWKQVPNVSAGSEFDETNHYIYTTVDLSNLGTVQGNATLTLQGNTKVYGNVYGGGAKSNSNTNGGEAKTTVNILGGTYGTVDGGVVTGGNIYGGGMGDLASLATPEDPNHSNLAVTEGIVEVNIGNALQEANNVVINGSVFGCNNVNGSPTDDVTVHIYKTKHNSSNVVTGSGYAISQVFGGGNKAHYEPTLANKTATVHVHNCDNTIKYIYGGGNAANVGTLDTDPEEQGNQTINANTSVIIDGGRHEWVFGGGNGYSETNNHNDPIAPNYNPGANIYGNTSVTYHAGHITYLFGGSNEWGSVSGEKNMSLFNDGACSVPENRIVELYGGNNKAPTYGDVSLTMLCLSDPCPIDFLFGGSRDANITGNVELTVNGGHYGYVFGGNNRSGIIGGDVTLNLYGGTITEAAFGGNKGGGSIQGNITVNVEDQCACPLQVNNIFGAGDLAVYTAPTGSGANDFNPVVNVKHICGTNTITGNVYGGGNGDPEDDTQTKGSVTGNPKVIIGDLTTEHETYRAAISGNVYGGGNAAKVVGNTTVLMQKDNSTVGHDIYGGGNLADVSGSVEVEVTGGTVTQDVYGGGALADVNVTDGALTTGATTTVTLAGGTVRDIYGGGLGRRENTPIAAKVYGPVTVMVNSGTVRDVFGCNNENGAPQSTVQVNINNNVSRNVYGGGNLAAYTGIPDVNINAGTVTGSVFGGGNQAGVGGGDVTMTDGCVLTGIYGGCNTSGNVGGNIAVNVNGGTIGTDADYTANVHGGGYGSSTSTSGNVVVNIAQEGASTGPTIYGDVYGGSALGSVNTSSNTTTVTLNKGTINGDLYGGGLGQNEPTPIEALVNGAVQVTVNSGTVTGSVYGCNNVNGAPQSTVNVDIYGTDDPGSGYALGHVFGGGNAANYTNTPVVVVHNCDNSIEYVYGGGNAASVKGTDVTVYGGNTIGNVFGGCYGANVTTGGTNVKIRGGKIGKVFGGNNQSGTITGTIKVNVNKEGDNDPNGTSTACNMYIDELYSGGNVAESAAGEITIGCTGTLEPLGSGEHYGINQEGIQYVYGGANQAEITSNITLNINSGIVENVFGGNNQSGSISGIIKVNINKDNTASCAEYWYVGNVYGGGNVAAYSAPSGSLNYPEVNILNGTVSQDVFGGGLGEDARVTGNPVVNINGGTVSGKTFGGGSAAPVTGNPTVNAYKGTAPYVYGGGLGSTAIVTGNPLVLVNQTSGQTLTVTDVFGGGDEAGVTGNTTVQLKAGTVTRAFGGGNVADITGTTTVSLQGATATNIYGGGNEANVSSTASVSVSSGSISGGGGVYGGCNTKGSVGGKITVEVTGGTIGADGNPSSVFGGGYGGYDDNTHPGTSTNGDVEVTINGGTIYGDVYGGSAKGSVNAADEGNTTVTLTSGTIHGDLYGGGLGDATHAAAVNGAVQVTVNGGTVANVFGCNNVNGAPQSTVTVDIDETSANTMSVTNVYGGGNMAAYNGTPDVNIIAGTVSGRIFGGGNNIADDPDTGNHLGVTGSDVEMTGGIVLGGVYGGCNQQGAVTTNSVVKIYGGTVGSQEQLNANTVANVFGGGLGATTYVNGNVTVTVNKGTGVADAPTIYGDVYGGSALGSVNFDGTKTTTVNIMDGTLVTNRTSQTMPNGQVIYTYTGGNVYGGGLGQKQIGNDPTTAIAAVVKGVVTVNIGSGTVVTSGEYAGYTTTPNTGNATIGGNVYGCNNANGSPEQNVTVNIFKTAHTPDNEFENGTGYAIANVFGGGNEADYTTSGMTASVNVYGCDNTIERSFGGGNAAAAPHVATFIQGGRFAQVFGGGNGERGSSYGADITNGIELTIHGGNVGQFFGGSNQNGVVTGSLSTTVDNNGPCGGDLTITEFFCGGNFVNINGDLETTITCSDGMNVTSLYGGCNMAYITGHVVLNLYGGNYTNVYGGSKGDLASLGSGHIDQAANIGQYVTLNLYGGTIENVFGGSNVNGNIGGVITVNVLDVEDPVCPLHITNIYGGSNMTNYTPTGSNVISPVVNVIHAKYGIGGNVYGGSKGVSGTEVDVMANPLVNIGYDASLNGYIPSTGANAYTVPLSPRAIVAGSVFGGGDAAKVQGNTAIFLRNKAKVFGNVYGGGNMGEVTGNTKVIVNGADQ